MERTALKRVKDYQESAAWSKYADYRAVVCDDGWEDDICVDGDESYTLHHYRRASFIVWHRSDGFQDVDEYPTEAAAIEVWHNIIDAIESDRQAAAEEAHPDEWIIHIPGMAQITYTHRHECRSWARHELARIIRMIRRSINLGKNYDIRRNDAASFEVRDADSAIMSGSCIGHYWIEHIDNSEARERYLDWI